MTVGADVSEVAGAFEPRDGWSRLAAVLNADLQRYGESRRAHVEFLANPGFRFTVLFRLCQFVGTKRGFWKLLLLPLRLMLRNCSIRFGISIPWRTVIGPGLYIPHYGGIVVNERCVLGKGVTIGHGVTLGKRAGGWPAVGDGVYLGPGSKILGGIRLGAKVRVGANAVVLADIPDGATAVGIPARIVGDGAVQ